MSSESATNREMVDKSPIRFFRCGERCLKTRDDCFLIGKRTHAKIHSLVHIMIRYTSI